MTGLHFHPLRVRQVHADTDDARVVTFEVPPALEGSFRFAPGQYLTVRRPGDDVRRSYSICAAPGEALRVGVRHVPGGTFSSWLHAELKPGDWLEAMEPQGRFGTALDRRPRHVLAIAGGSGITPILSIVKTVLEADASARVTLLYGNRQAASTMFKEELEDLKNRHLTRLAMHAVFSREAMDAPLSSGRLDADKIARFLRLAGGVAAVDEVFVCGPHAMNDEVEAALLAAGLPAERIHIERFGIPPSAADAQLHAPKEGDATTARIAIVRDGLTREVGFQPTDESILAAASRAGLDVPYSCRSGVCATCRAKLIEGQVRMDRNFALEKADLEAGFVLTCQAHPLSERVVVSFDER
ncbi:MAG: phenylacetate-CoA oxygenase/reductase subunit PaaK [Burkholderiales bacterium]|nr:phenylacetate-CoA oxygenase/reductase subunit PaaK [Burkholderiales bacterium]